MEQIRKTLQKYLPQAAFCLAAFWLFWQIYPIIFAVHDDLRNYTLVRSGTVLSDAAASARNGRISHLWNHLLLAVPFLANKVWFYKLIQFGTLLFDIFAGWRLLRSHADRRLADLAAVLAVSWACISDQHNLLIAYAFSHQLPFGFACIALYHFGNACKKPSRRETLISCIFLLLSVMIYEAFAAILLLMMLWALTHPEGRSVSYLQWLRRAAHRILPQLCTVGAYCAVYLLWQQIYPPQYDGIALDLQEPILSLAALKTYALSFFPSAELMHRAKEQPITLPELLRLLRHFPAWISAALTAAAFYRLVPRIRLHGEALHNLLLLSGAGIFVPCLLIACTEKYLDWLRRGVTGYLPSFYSFFFLVVFLSALAVRVYHAVPPGSRRKTVHALLTAAVFCTCLAATAVTQLWKPYFAEWSLRCRNFDAVLSAELPALDSDWQLFVPDNPGIHNRQDFSEDYLKIYNPAEIAYLHSAEDLSADHRTLCIRMPEHYAFAVIGEADSALRAQVLTFRSLVPQTFNLTLYDTEGEALYYENVRSGSVLTLPEGKYFDLSVRVAETANG